VSRSRGRSLRAASRCWCRTREERRRWGVCRGREGSARGVPSAMAWAATGKGGGEGGEGVIDLGGGGPVL
jgi:hypothetical protein